MIRALVIDSKCNSLQLGQIFEVESFKNRKVGLVGVKRMYDPTQFIFYDNDERIYQSAVHGRLKGKKI